MNKALEKIYDWILPLILKLNRRETINKEVGKVVVISLHKLGDAVFTISALNNILKYHNNKKIILVCFRETLEVFKLALNNIEYIILDRDDFYCGERIGGFHARKLIKDMNAERIYDITGCIQSASLLYNCHANEIIGINEMRYKPLYDVFSLISNGPHMSDIYLNAVRPVIKIESDDSFESGTSIPQKLGYILIHPFAGWSAKEWGIEKYLNLARKLSNPFEVRFIIPSGHLPENNLKIMGKEFKIVESKNIPDLIENIKNCSLLIGNDSGPVHIANLMKKPVFTIYGPTNPSYHQPKSGLSSYIVKKIVCSPKVNEKLCFTDGGRKGCPSFECMKQLSVDEVFLAVTKFINKINKEE
jgi:ADP-heptose:LPS heptosyltransferase